MANAPRVQPGEGLEDLRDDVHTAALAEASILQDLVQKVVAPVLEEEDVEAADAQFAVEAHDMRVRLRAPKIIGLGLQL